MSTSIIQLAKSIGFPLVDRCYKRWITDNIALVFVLSKDTQSYLTLKYEVATSTFTQWLPTQEHKVYAQPINIRYYGTNEELLKQEEFFIKPRLAVSPNRKHFCWFDTDKKWSVVNLKDDSATRRSRTDEQRLSGQAIWFANNRNWGEPISSISGKSFVNINVYSIDHEETVSRSARGVQAGICIGTTPENELIIVKGNIKTIKYELTETKICQLTRVDLSSIICKGARNDVILPSGYSYEEAILSPDGKRIAWLLTWREGVEQKASLWLSDSYGQNIHLIKEFDSDDSFSLPQANANSNHQLYDLEWLPEGEGISFIFDNNICCLDIDALPH